MGCEDAEVISCVAQISNNTETEEVSKKGNGEHVAAQLLKDGFDEVESCMSRRKTKAEIQEWILEIWNRS